jgi:hypothetical protein
MTVQIRVTATNVMYSHCFYDNSFTLARLGSVRLHQVILPPQSVYPTVGNVAVGCFREVFVPEHIRSGMLAHRCTRHATTGAHVEIVLPTSTATTPENIFSKPYSCSNHFPSKFRIGNAIFPRSMIR